MGTKTLARRTSIVFLFVSFVLTDPQAAFAQLTDITQVDEGGNVNAPGGTIAKSLTEQIGAGQGDVNTFGSSIYLIKRDPARSVRRGRQLFQRKFTREQGLGPRVNFASTGDITTTPALGAGLSDSCASCHGRPRGAAGFGGDVVTRPDSRDAPHLFGLGLVEQLAEEMTAQLRAQRDSAIERAQRRNRRQFQRLHAKGVRFGVLIAHPDGSVDTSRVRGVDESLRIKPFFAQGGTVSMREFIVGAFKAEMGMETSDPILCAVTEDGATKAITSPAGFVFDPTLDTFERPPVCDDSEDGAGVVAEVDPALVDHLEFYLLNYFKPGRYRVSDEAKLGRFLMDEIRCTDCHAPNMVIESDRRVADVETVYDRQRGIFNQLFATASTRFVVQADGDEFPQLLPAGEQFVVENFFSDLKRHNLGPAFHERQHDGTLVTEFVTEPLWGVGTSAPYGHDGRSINLDQVIRRHGGEASRSRDSYVALSGRERNAILAFLETLVLFPPDDTASNLNPGNPNTSDPQNPAEHGSINLGALFQIAAEGPE